MTIRESIMAVAIIAQFAVGMVLGLNLVSVKTDYEIAKHFIRSMTDSNMQNNCIQGTNITWQN